ncbi:MAG: flagellar hook protein FlgE [Rickettsiales bacterium]
MSAFQSLSIGITGLQAQSRVIGVTSDNISNVNTVGYKRIFANFETLIQNSNDTVTYSPNGSAHTRRNVISKQGEVFQTGVSTDLAISGNGFFSVSQNTPAAGDILYTRAGSFRPNANGDIVNGAGFFLQGWALDANGDLATALTAGGVAASTAIGALSTVNISDTIGSIVPTTEVTIQANLTASQAIYADLPAYDATDITANLSSGSIPTHFNRAVTIIDSLGESHDVMMGFLKTGINTWAVELYASPATDAASANPQFAAGTVTFNGDGTLASISSELSGAVSTSWANGGTNSITFDWGTAGAIFGTPGATTIGLTDGLSQLDDVYQVDFLEQNGSTPGALDRLEVAEDGTLSAFYDNGAVRALYRIPLATFVDPNLLESQSGNVFKLTSNTSDALYSSGGQENAGTIFSGGLEASNVDLETQLTTIIVAQRAYESNARIVSVSDEILQDLTRMGA